MKINKFLSDIKNTCLNLNFTIEIFSEDKINKVLDKNKNNFDYCFINENNIFYQYL